MKSNQNTNNELEQFLKDEVKQHRMYPSEQIWENIRTELHGSTSWRALPIIAILIVVTLTITTIFNYPPADINLKKIIPLITSQNKKIDNKVISDALQKELNPNTFTNNTLASINSNTSTNYLMDDNSLYNDSSKIIVANIAVSSTSSNKKLNYVRLSSSILLNDKPFNTIITNPENIDISNIISQEQTDESSVLNKLSIEKFNNNVDENPTSESYLKEFKQDKKKSITNNRFEWQLYVTPSSSYRKLIDDESRNLYLPNNANSSSNLVYLQSLSGNLNKSVRHKPALGFEIGATVSYKFSKNIKFKTGLQFNIRQYYIDAYKALGIATIAFVQNNRLDSISLLTTLSNNQGSQTTQLDNKLYQVSIPIGVEWKFLHLNKFSASVDASIQPTFTLNKNVYIISTDYKYYTNGSSFFRKWNVNTSLGINFEYKLKNTTWYIGPQIRYQHLPTYNDLYPIKEYRWDYGIKLGFSKPIF